MLVVVGAEGEREMLVRKGKKMGERGVARVVSRVAGMMMDRCVGLSSPYPHEKDGKRKMDPPNSYVHGWMDTRNDTFKLSAIRLRIDASSMGTFERIG